jgi:hypothetical protein
MSITFICHHLYCAIFGPDARGTLLLSFPGTCGKSAVLAEPRNTTIEYKAAAKDATSHPIPQRNPPMPHTIWDCV